MNDGTAKALAMVAKDFSEVIGSVQEYGKQLEAFKSICSLSVREDEYAIRYRSEINLKRDDLPVLRKAVGRVTVVGKHVPSDHDKTKEIVVTIKPMAEAFSKLRFTYRTKLRKGGKCDVVEQVSTYRSLVCRA